MKKIYFILTMAMTFGCWVFGQDVPQIEWSKNYGGTFFRDFEATSDGGYILTKRDDIKGNIQKLNADGTIQWERIFDNGNFVKPHAILQTSDGGYMFVGENAATFSGKGWISKLNSSGETEWEKSFGGTGTNFSTELLATQDGGFLVGGRSNSTGTNGGQDFWVTKVDASGEVLWQKFFGGTRSDILQDMIATTDGGFLLVGQTQIGTSSFALDYFIVKIDASGNAQWTKTYGGTGRDEAMGVIQTASGEYLVVGNSASQDGHISNPIGEFDRWLIKLDANGEKIWDKSYGGTLTENSTRFIKLSNGEFIITGLSGSTDGDVTSNYGGLDAWLTHINIDGDLTWQGNFGGSLDDYFTRGVENADGSLTLAGFSSSTDFDLSGNTQTGIWVMKFALECVAPTFEVSTENEICSGQSIELIVDTDETATVNWYDTMDGTTPIFIGNSYETSILDETTKFWVEAVSATDCVSDRTEVTVNVTPSPDLENLTTTYEICSGNEANLYANSPNNVIFWYENENDSEYLYHGNLFVTEALTENTTYWVEAYNLSTGCTSERFEVIINVSEAIVAPTAASTQEFVAGSTLADLIVEHTGTLTWYADAQLTQELPETTLVVVGTTYYVTQSAGACESSAVAILVDTFLENGNLSSDKFAYYPNPVKDVLNFKGNEIVKSVQIFDLGGKLILNQNSNSISNINLSSFPKGTYVVKVKTEKQEKVFQIIKN